MARKDHSYNSGRIHRASGEGNAATPRGGQAVKRGKKPKGKRNGKKIALVSVLLALLLLVGTAVGLVSCFDARYFNEGALGALSGDFADNTLKGHFNILLVGIDKDDTRSHALTDMIMYISFDTTTNSATMLQIPRDTYVGTEYSVDGKINSAMTTGPDKDNPINNLARVFSEQYKLPVNYYIGIDMEGLRGVTDALGPIKVYVPKTMSNEGSYLEEGWRWLDTDSLEFFLRNRKGAGMERSDIDRLENQRYFYSALFRRFMNLSTSDLASLLPVLEHYCDTNFSVGKFGDLLKLGNSALNLDTSNVVMLRPAGATSVRDYDGFYVIDLYGRPEENEPGFAALLNEYLRDEDAPVSAEELAGSKFPAVNLDGYALYESSVQQMTELQEEEGGADVDVEPGS